ncbi:MAG: phosphatidate cytidylyltransferase [Planctomycetota bacterium]
MLKYRLIFGPIMIAGLVALLWSDQAFGDAGNWPGLLILLVMVLPGIRLAAGELSGLFKAKGVQSGPQVLTLIAALGCIEVYALLLAEPRDQFGRAMMVATAAVFAVIFGMCWQARSRETRDTMLAGAIAGFIFVYLGIMPGFMLAIRIEHSAWVLGAVLLVTKSCDIGAYFTGRALGKHKLISWLSPGKTWEGLAGGLILAGVASLLLLMPLADLPVLYALFAGAVLGLVGQGGDLIASMLKRDAGVKDSGSSIPGFGGILDVIDSPLIAAPVGFWLLYAYA